MKALKINILYSKKADGQAFKSAEMEKSARNFSHGLDLSVGENQTRRSFLLHHYLLLTSLSSTHQT